MRNTKKCQPIKLQDSWQNLNALLSANAYCKDPIWLEPKTGMDPGLQSPNNKFVECGIKS